MATSDTNDARNDEDRRRYFRDIGLESTQGRIRMLERRAAALRTGPRGVRGGSASSSPRMDRIIPGGSLREELELLRREQAERVRKFREDLVDEWRQHEVSLIDRPTSAELEDPELKHLTSIRRPHRCVVVGRDEREIKGMPKQKLCVSEGLKRSLGKMRENLFQRRLNLAIYEKKASEWALPQLRGKGAAASGGVALPGVPRPQTPEGAAGDTENRPS
mmetsp:Transcript_64086/g.139406  ORF Transcript_64086/g.139406 Transcript_64086/m.139406 type:complete len:219 (-) Transcript_64086:65-721(-)